MSEPEVIAEPRASLVTAGQVLGAKYRVDRSLACGGMGVVWAATHIELGHRVAIKVLSIEGSAEVDASAAARFRREARSGARLRSEHICRVLDTGALDDDTPFLVMEYLEGRDVGDLLEARRVLSVDEAAHIAYQACLGLIETHAAGLVHRDLKPSNLFLARQPDGTESLKLLDFGIAKNLLADETHAPSLTQTATLLGRRCTCRRSSSTRRKTSTRAAICGRWA